MSNLEYCLLTSNEYTILETMRDRCVGSENFNAELLRRKLRRAIVMFPHDIPPTVVTLNSRVTFRVDENVPETRILVRDESRDLIGLTISLGSRRGLAMLGLSEGQSIALQKPDTDTETITIQQVVYQPEAARLALRVAPQVRQPEASPFLKVVHRSDYGRQLPMRRVPKTVSTEFDDPGPNAA